MKAWLTCFFVLFILAKLFLWLKGFIVPMPVYILGGAFLAIASNYGAMQSSHPLASRAFSSVKALKSTTKLPLSNPMSVDQAKEPS